MNFSFENKVAIVTGAGSGIGLATAKAFAATVLWLCSDLSGFVVGASIVVDGGQTV